MQAHRRKLQQLWEVVEMNDKSVVHDVRHEWRDVPDGNY
jgi:hypothetical protein